MHHNISRASSESLVEAQLDLAATLPPPPPSPYVRMRSSLFICLRTGAHAQADAASICAAALLCQPSRSSHPAPSRVHLTALIGRFDEAPVPGLHATLRVCARTVRDVASSLSDRRSCPIRHHKLLRAGAVMIKMALSGGLVLATIMGMQAHLAAADGNSECTDPSGRGYIASGTPSCNYFPLRGTPGSEYITSDGFCDAQICDGCTEYAQALNTPYGISTISQLEVRGDCLNDYSNGLSGVYDIGTVCHNNFLDMQNCDRGSQCSRDLQAQTRVGEKYCATLSEAECRASPPVPCAGKDSPGARSLRTSALSMC